MDISLSAAYSNLGFLLYPWFSFFLNVTSPDVTMAANFTISSDSDSEPPEEVEEGQNNQPSTGEEQQLPQRHTLTLPDLRMAGRKPQRIVGRGVLME